MLSAACVDASVAGGGGGGGGGGCAPLASVLSADGGSDVLSMIPITSTNISWVQRLSTFVSWTFCLSEYKNILIPSLSV